MEVNLQSPVAFPSPESVVVGSHHHKQHFQDETLSSEEYRLCAWRSWKKIQHEDWSHATDAVQRKKMLLLMSSEESMTQLL